MTIRLPYIKDKLAKCLYANIQSAVINVEIRCVVREGLFFTNIGGHTTHIKEKCGRF